MNSNTYILAILLLSAVCAAPPPHTKPNETPVVEPENNTSGADSSQSSNKTSDGPSNEESGPLIPDFESVPMEGNSTWTSPEGVTYIVTYVEEEGLGTFPTIIRQGAGGPGDPLDEQQLRTGPFGRPGEGFPKRPALAGNAATSLIVG